MARDGSLPALTICRPGERMVAGRPYVFDAGLLRAWEVCQTKLDAPADLAGLSDDDLGALVSDGITLADLSRGLDMDLLHRASAERRRRGIDSTGRRAA